VDFISAKDAAKILGISRRAIYDLIYSGRIEAQKFERSYLVDPASVEAELRRRQKKNK
jgi:excisionase family DNA binding protein